MSPILGRLKGFVVPAFVGALTVGCAATNEPAAEEPRDDENYVTEDYPERSQYPLGLGCGWEIASNADLMNVFYPDENAKYWVSLIPMLPGTRLRINGKYPNVRYFSFNVYDPLLRPTDAIADFEISPDGDGQNPFVLEGAKTGDSYTAYIEFTGAPENPAPNTVYAGEFNLGETKAPQPLLTGLFYRTYAPDEGFEFDGGVGLPILTLETAEGERELLPMADCVEPLLPTLGNTIPELGINGLLGNVDFPDDPFLLLDGKAPFGLPGAESHVFHGIPEFYTVFLLELLGLSIGDQLAEALPSTGSGGFLSNIHNAYTYTIFYRSKGNVAVFRAKAPTFKDQEGVEFSDEQLRYWSICSNEVASQRYFDCVRDDETVVDENGYFTIVISDPQDQPVNAIEDNGINWMGWGPYIDVAVVYRHMLPSSFFNESVHDVERGQRIEDVMGEYAPQTAYCTTDIVEAAGDSPADIFEACAEYTNSLSD